MIFLSARIGVKLLLGGVNLSRNSRKQNLSARIGVDVVVGRYQ